MRNLDKKVFNRLEEVCVSYKFLNDDVCYFYGVSWKNYYDKFEDCRDIVSIDYDSKYMNRKADTKSHSRIVSKQIQIQTTYT